MDLTILEGHAQGAVTIVHAVASRGLNRISQRREFRAAYQVFNDFAGDPEQWAASFTGAGDKAFCRRQKKRPEKWQAGRGKRGMGFSERCRGLTARSMATSDHARSTASPWAAG